MLDMSLTYLYYFILIVYDSLMFRTYTSSVFLLLWIFKLLIVLLMLPFTGYAILNVNDLEVLTVVHLIIRCFHLLPINREKKKMFNDHSG